MWIEKEGVLWKNIHSVLNHMTPQTRHGHNDHQRAIMMNNVFPMTLYISISVRLTYFRHTLQTAKENSYISIPLQLTKKSGAFKK